jgi:tetratricopeptide (TPR) repeat protein
MKKFTSVMLLLTGLTFAHAADKYAPTGNTLADALQWLAIQTACVGQYSMAFTGDYVSKDPQDHYQVTDIREYFAFLAENSSRRTRVPTFYGICFDYAKSAYDDITASSNYYGKLGVKEWYIVADGDTSKQIVLYDPVARGQQTILMNGVPLKEIQRRNVRTHDDITGHAWLWVIGNDGTIYWIDPTWTDNGGYVVWGVVRNGREEQRAAQPSLCAVSIPGGASFASFTRGDANKNQGNWDQAIDDYNEAIKIDPNSELAYNNRGLANYYKGSYDRAIADFNEALRLKSDYAEAYNNRGRAYYAKNDYDKAFADYTQAITLNSQFPFAYNNRAYVYLARKDYDSAFADVHSAMKLMPREATWYATRGEIFINIKEWKRAVQDLELAVRMSPNFTRAKELLERARLRRWLPF